jgi:hypothetical protein
MSARESTSVSMQSGMHSQAAGDALTPNSEMTTMNKNFSFVTMSPCKRAAR